MGTDLVAKLKKSFAKRGWRGTAKLVVLNGVWFIRDLSPRQYLKRRQARDFDRHFGIATSDIIATSDLEIDSTDRAFGTYHDPTPIAALMPILQNLGIEYPRFVFIDLGSGLGRAVFLASQFPFHKIVGVEYSATLHARAERNLAAANRSLQQCKDIELACLDASKFAFPPEPTVLYMFNPFGPEVMGPVLGRIERSLQEHPREMIVVYYNPTLDEMIGMSRALERVERGSFHAIYRARRVNPAT